MLKWARRAVSHVGDMSHAEFIADDKTQDAVLYCVGVIGEAAGHVTDSTRATLDIDWHAIRGMRNRIVHGYNAVQLRIVWRTAAEHLPQLITALEQYLANH